jgi:branched-chain amino acid transport system permease protein
MIAEQLILTFINVLLAWSTYVVVMTGGLSFASGAFMAVGCYAAAILTTRYGWPLYPAWIAASIVCAGFGGLVGFPSLRVQGIYLILVTLGVSASTIVILENIDAFGGSMGIGGMSGTTLWDATIAVIVVGAALIMVSRSPVQRTLDAIREDERVAGALGINVVFVKVVAFVVSAAIAGYAGALYGHYVGYVRPDTFSVDVALFIVLYVVLGGTNNLYGPALGAIVMTLLPEYIAFLKEWRSFVFPLALVILIAIRPEGLLSFRVRTFWLSARGAVAKV